MFQHLRGQLLEVLEDAQTDQGTYEKRPPGRPKEWAEAYMEDRIKDPENSLKYYIKVVKPRLEARKAEALNDHW